MEIVILSFKIIIILMFKFYFPFFVVIIIMHLFFSPSSFSSSFPSLIPLPYLFPPLPSFPTSLFSPSFSLFPFRLCLLFSLLLLSLLLFLLLLFSLLLFILLILLCLLPLFHHLLPFLLLRFLRHYPYYYSKANVTLSCLPSLVATSAEMHTYCRQLILKRMFLVRCRFFSG